MSYEKDIRIDESALDVEWLQQPHIMLKYARISADASYEMDLAKQNLELIKAELDKEIREDPEKFDIAKVTETVVVNTITRHPAYKAALLQYQDLKLEYDYARNAVSALHAKKEALENLVRLYGMQYFAGPNMPRDLSSEVKQREQQRKVDSQIKIGRRKK